MSEIRFTVDLGRGPVDAAITNPFSAHDTVDDRGCPDCGGAGYFAGCTADGCNGWACPDCGTGCDADFFSAEDGGRCAAALARDARD
ncbi:hypothetical protein OG618_37305 (plasmid) [Kitasatospora sp. NBC_01246]|uniref:hypothetical protein n=1 Tax=Kitasatospora sp. NBC_01246 TaxID=2903570 RepID=UPI002E30B4B3|nr:hypothetical protein [Kitasatospora sp. NBC_01246]